MKQFIKNIEHNHVISLAEQINYQPGQITSKTLSQNSAHTLTLFAFEKGEEISTHESTGDALVMALDGVGSITVGSTTHTLRAGESIVMPARVPHAVSATERFKMLLAVIFPDTPEKTENNNESSR